MTLGRPATGLPRYYMDCGWYRHPRFAGVPIESIAVFESIVGYCTEHATNGYVPEHPEDLAVALGLRASWVKKGVPPLVDRGALIPGSGSLYVRGWADHNPLKDEVVSYRDSQSARGSYGNHVRHHVKKGIVNDDCIHCLKSPSATSLATLASDSLGLGWVGNPPQPPLLAEHRDAELVIAEHQPTEPIVDPKPYLDSLRATNAPGESA